MSARRGGLGRGLGALLPQDASAIRAVDSPHAHPGPARYRELAVDSIGANPKQPRTVFDEDSLTELVTSVREVGILQPVIVREATPGRYELVMGERRLRAAREAGLATVPALIRDTPDDALLRDALLENLHREDLNPLEEAAAYEQLLGELGATHEQVAQRIGRSRSQVTNTIRLLQLPPESQQLLADGRIQAGHARALLSLGDAEAQNALALRVSAEDLSVRETEELVRRYVEGPPKKAETAGKDAKAASDPGVGEVEEILSEQLATRVQIQMGKKRGRVIIEFGSPDDLERIVSEIIGSGPGLAPD